jgi:hypothetical protein
MTPQLEAAIAAIQTLSPTELQQLSQVIQSYLQDEETSAQQAAFHRALIESGLVQKIKKNTFESGTRQPIIESQGEPVSQTIVEERR